MNDLSMSRVLGPHRRPDPVHLRPSRRQARGPGPTRADVRHVHWQGRLSGAGRPELRTAAWRAVWGCLQTNKVYAARYRHLTTREANKLKPTQAQTVIAGAILRQLHAVVVHRQAWDPTIATGHARGQEPSVAA